MARSRTRRRRPRRSGGGGCAAGRGGRPGSDAAAAAARPARRARSRRSVDGRRAARSSSTPGRCWATTAPSSNPPNPGAGSTGSTRWPSDTRRVGTAGRVCKTSSSASNMHERRYARPSDERAADRAQLAGGGRSTSDGSGRPRRQSATSVCARGRRRAPPHPHRRRRTVADERRETSASVATALARGGVAVGRGRGDRRRRTDVVRARRRARRRPRRRARPARPPRSRRAARRRRARRRGRRSTRRSVPAVRDLGLEQRLLEHVRCRSAGHSSSSNSVTAASLVVERRHGERTESRARARRTGRRRRPRSARGRRARRPPTHAGHRARRASRQLGALLEAPAGDVVVHLDLVGVVGIAVASDRAAHRLRRDSFSSSSSPSAHDRHAVTLPPARTGPAAPTCARRDRNALARTRRQPVLGELVLGPRKP